MEMNWVKKGVAAIELEIVIANQTTGEHLGTNITMTVGHQAKEEPTAEMIEEIVRAGAAAKSMKINDKEVKEVCRVEDKRMIEEVKTAYEIEEMTGES